MSVEDVGMSRAAGASLFRLAFEQSPDPAGFATLDGEWLRLNDAARDLLGATRRELIGSRSAWLVDRPGSAAPISRFATALGAPDSAVYLEVTVSTVTAGAERVLYVQMRDTTQSRVEQERLVHLAGHDALTGLLNRGVFLDHLDRAIRRGRITSSSVGVLLADLDQFKLVNDSLGHPAGDQLLVTLAPLLESALRSGDALARFGGDEFVVLMRDVADEDDALRRAAAMAEALTHPVILPNGPHQVSASIGIALSGRRTTVDQLLADADTAMYQAKARGRGCVALFDQTLRDASRRRLDLEHDLRLAVPRSQFELLFQPVVSSDTLQPSGIEALLRWHHPTRGLLGPGEFVAVAEETGAIREIGSWVIHEACRQLRRWLGLVDTGDRPFRVAVNVSGVQLMQADFDQVVRSALRASGLDARHLGLEITESVLLAADDELTRRLEAVKALGVRLLLDDFGTGYSSLSYLHRYPIDVLKIDRSFVSGSTEPRSAAIVEAIIRLARALGLEVVAEGIETDEQLRLLRALGCHRLQGFHICRPLVADQVGPWLVSQGAPRAARPAEGNAPSPHLGAPTMG